MVVVRSATGAASEWRPPLAWCVAASPESPRHHRRSPSTPRAVPAGPRHARRFLRALPHRVTTPGLAAGGTTSRPQSWRTLSRPEDSALAILPPKTGFCMRRLERDSCPSLLILTLLFRFCLLDLILPVPFPRTQPPGRIPRSASVSAFSI